MESLEKHLEQVKKETNSKPLFGEPIVCPQCNKGEITMGFYRWQCNNCGFSFMRKYQGDEVIDEEKARLLVKGEMVVLKMKSKKGFYFTVHARLKNGKLTFHFPKGTNQLKGKPSWVNIRKSNGAR